MRPASDTRNVSLMAKDQYMREVRWAEYLTDEEEHALLQKMIRAKQEPANQWRACVAQEARTRLVEGYQPRVIALANKLRARCRGLEILDLISEGNIGLLQALDRWEGGERPFFLYAQAAIRGEMIRALFERNGMVRFHRRMWQHLMLLNQVEEQFGGECSAVEVAAAMGVRVERVEELRNLRRCSQMGSLQAVLVEREDAEAYLLVENVFAGSAVEESLSPEREAVLYEALETALDERERQVARLRYGLGHEPHTWEAIGREVGLSDSGVQKVDLRVKKKLYHALAPAMTVVPEELIA